MPDRDGPELDGRDLHGRVALVTGAGGQRGVGRATALKLAQRGADVAITDVNRAAAEAAPGDSRQPESDWRGLDDVADEVRELGRECWVHHCDLSVAAEVEQLVQDVVEQRGHVDILVNNARAIVGQDRVPITDLDDEVWLRFLAINTTAVFRLTKLVGRHMISHGTGGRIVNIGSTASKQAMACGAAYSASKFAVVGLTQAAALDLAPYGITVNAACPGTIDTDRFSYWEQSQAEAAGMSSAEFRAGVIEQSKARTPLGRIASPEDVANLVAFLASDEAAFITGQAYLVNGGALML
jgi:NAD(P)-dependent dehydrogenase (short-subunit alcohol dehydrogenase family)